MAKQVKLSQEKLEELGQFVADTWDEDNQDKQEWLQSLPKWIKAYQGRPEPKDLPWKGASNLKVPITETAVDAIHPRVMAACYNPRPIVGFNPQEESDTAKVRRAELFLDWAVREDINLFPILDRGNKSLLVNGMQFYKIVWDLKIRKIRDKHKFPNTVDPMMAIRTIYEGEKKFVEAINRVGEGDYEAILKDRKVKIEVENTEHDLCVYTEREEVIRDAPLVTSIDPEDIVIPTDAGLDLTNDCDHVIQRFRMTVDQIKREIQKGVFRKLSDEDMEHIENLVSESGQPDDNTHSVKTIRDGVTGADQQNRTASPTKLDMLDAYVLWDIDDDGYDEQVIVTIAKAQPKIVLRVNRLEEVYRHGMRPFVFFGYEPVANSVWCIGLPQIVEGLQEEFNIIHNQRVDAGQINNMPWGWYVPTSTVNPDRIPIEPGYLYPVDDINSVKMHQPGNVHTWSFQEEGGLWALFERRTKISDLTLGRIGETQGAARTATGVQALSAQQATGFDLIIRRVQESFKLMLQQIFALYQQYMPPGKKIRVQGVAFNEQPTLVDRESITGKFDMIFTGNSLSTDREVERNTAVFMAQSVMSPGAQSFLLQLGIMQPQGVAAWYDYLLGVFDVPHKDRIISVPANTGPLKPDEVINRILGGEMVQPKMNEDHRSIVTRIQELLQSKDAQGLSPEVQVLLQMQIPLRMEQEQKDQMIKQSLEQMAMIQQQYAGLGRVPGTGGAPPQLPSGQNRLAF